MRTVSATFLGLLLGVCTARADVQPQVPAVDRVRLGESFRLAQAVGNQVWPNWDKTPFAVLLVTREHEFLIRHPKPPADFAPCGVDPVLNCPVAFRKRLFSPQFEATFPVGGPSTVVIGQAENTASKTSTRWVLTALHEHFHQLQNAQPRHFAEVDSLGLSRGDTTGMWMLNFPFPYEKPDVREQFTALLKCAGEALQARNRPEFLGRLTAYWDVKTKLRSLVSADDYKYLNFQLWQEGVARYTEYRLARLAAALPPPAKEFTDLKDYRSYAELGDAIWKRIEQDLATLRLDKAKREVVYSLGAAEALMLDTAFPDWRSRYFEERFSLDSHIRAALGVEVRPNLGFQQEGNTLVVSMTVEVPDAPHIVWTNPVVAKSADPYLLGPRYPATVTQVELNYMIFMNRDDPVRHVAGKTRKIDVVWRIPDHKRGDEPYLVKKSFEPSAAELQDLAPRLQKLGDEGARRRKSSEFAP